jgi:hypothetical protein
LSTLLGPDRLGHFFADRFARNALLIEAAAI